MVKRLNVDLDVNNTDTVRTGYIYFHADGKTLVTSYTQYHYLNIERPVRRNYQFTLQDTARQVRDSLIFQTYGDDWTLAFKGEAPAWVRLADGRHFRACRKIYCALPIGPEHDDSRTYGRVGTEEPGRFDGHPD